MCHVFFGVANELVLYPYHTLFYFVRQFEELGYKDGNDWKGRGTHILHTAIGSVFFGT
jgi:hypothetical protein